MHCVQVSAVHFSVEDDDVDDDDDDDDDDGGGGGMGVILPCNL